MPQSSAITSEALYVAYSGRLLKFPWQTASVNSDIPEHFPVDMFYRQGSLRALAKVQTVDLTLEVRDILGRRIVSQALDGSTTSINVILRPGIYPYTLTSSGKTVGMGKLMVRQ